jgi:hypothetical protein
MGCVSICQAEPVEFRHFESPRLVLPLSLHQSHGRVCILAYVCRRVLLGMLKVLAGRKVLFLACLFAVSGALIGTMAWLGGYGVNVQTQPQRNDLPANGQANAPALDTYERARIRGEALRLAVNGKKEDGDMRDYYRSAFRLLHRMNDVHSRF